MIQRTRSKVIKDLFHLYWTIWKNRTTMWIVWWKK